MVVEDVLIDVPVGDQIRIKMISAGICASDGHVVWGEMQPGNLPLVLGHEGLGVVESVGEGVTSLKPGDMVMSNIMSQCGDCGHCSNPQNNFCPLQGLFAMGQVPNKKLASDQSDVYPFAGLGIFSEYALLRLSQVVKVSFKFV